jgi:hypothetical protein
MMNRRIFLSLIGVGALELQFMGAGAASPLRTGIGNGLPGGLLWLRQFHGKRTGSLLRSRRFRALIESSFPGVPAPFHGNQPLWAAVWSWMNRPGHVEVKHNRYLVACGNMAHCAPCRGMLWVDTKRTIGPPIVVLAFMSVTAKRELWIVSNTSLASRGIMDLPNNLVTSLGKWLRTQHPNHMNNGKLNQMILFDSSVFPEEPDPTSWGIRHYLCDRSFGARSVSTNSVHVGGATL